MSNDKVTKKRAPRVKKQPTKEEVLQALKQEKEDLNKIILVLKDEEIRFTNHAGLFPKINELVKDELADLADDLEDLDNEYNKFLNAP